MVSRAGHAVREALGWRVMGDAVGGFYYTNRRFRRWKYRLVGRPMSRVTAWRAGALPSVHPWADAITKCLKGVVRREEQPGLGRVAQLRAALLASSQSIRVRDQAQPIASVCAGDSVSPERGFFLYCLARALAPAAVLELGTCLGVSAAYFSAALEANGSGRLVTIDVEPDKAEVAAAHLAGAQLDSRVRLMRAWFHDALPTLLTEAPGFQLVYVDGHHIEAATIGYFAQIADASRGATLVFDDIAWSPGMARAWKAIAADARVEFAGEAFGFGLVRVRP
jgi:predicted O-methyltransferase YrrM